MNNLIAYEEVIQARKETRKKKRILLISPNGTRESSISRFFRFPPLNLALLAALAPKYDYRIIDENAESIDFELDEIKKADIIGLTAMTKQIPRAYELADRFRLMGKTVIMGGMHVSALPQEALRHSDSVVIGEAEGIWPRLLDDYEEGKLKETYASEQLSDLSKLPLPRRDLLNGRNYLNLNTLQVSRGCPFRCTFCSVSRFFGAKTRLRPINKVIQEIEVMIKANQISGWRKTVAGIWGKTSTNPFAFLDDNIYANLEYSTHLFKALIPLRILWGGQASVNIATPEYEDLLRLAAESGCRLLVVGFESIDESSIREIGRRVNIPDHYHKAVRLFHKYGITVLGTFVFGSSSEDRGIFKRTVEFAQKIKLDIAEFKIITPLPGTALMENLKGRGRILVEDWAKYDSRTAVFAPSRMSAQELTQGEEWAWRQFYSWSSILRRAPFLRDWRRFLVYTMSNMAYRIPVGFRLPIAQLVFLSLSAGLLIVSARSLGLWLFTEGTLINPHLSLLGILGSLGLMAVSLLELKKWKG